MPNESEGMELVCDHCDGAFSITANSYWNDGCLATDGGRSIIACPTCISRMQQCPSCMSMVFDVQRVPDYITLANGHRELCASCWEQQIVVCSVCEERAAREETQVYLTGDHTRGRICDACSEGEYSMSCDNCGIIACTDDMSEVGELWYCAVCMRDRRNHVILPYSSQPTHRCLGKGPIYYGIELELENVTSRSTRDLGLRIRDDLMPADFCVLTSDASLTSGFEVKTRPASVAEHRKAWGKLFRDRSISRSMIGDSSDTAGYHIHATRAPLTELTIGKAVVFINSPSNRAFMERLAGRSSGNYCRYKPKTHSDIRSSDRTEALNLTKNNTIEFRVFNSTLNADTFFTRLEFAESLLNYCGTGKTSIRAVQNVKGFARHIAANNKNWPSLAEHIGKVCPQHV